MSLSGAAYGGKCAITRQSSASAGGRGATRVRPIQRARRSVGPGRTVLVGAVDIGQVVAELAHPGPVPATEDLLLRRLVGGLRGRWWMQVQVAFDLFPKMRLHGVLPRSAWFAAAVGPPGPVEHPGR